MRSFFDRTTTSVTNEIVESGDQWLSEAQLAGFITGLPHKHYITTLQESMM